MQIQKRVLVAIGAAYFIGYTRGATASNNISSQVGEGLNKIGDGLKDLAIELGIEYKEHQENQKLAEKAHSLYAEGGGMSHEEIAVELDISVEKVRALLDNSSEKDTETVDSDAEEEPAVTIVTHSQSGESSDTSGLAAT